MASIYRKGSKLWARIKDRHNDWTGKPTPYAEGDEAKAKRYAAELQRIEDAARAPTAEPDGDAAPMTVEAFGKAWLAKRKTKTVADDEGRLKIHVFPVIGHLLLHEVRIRHVRDLVATLRTGKLAPRTVRNVYGAMRTMFKSAVVEERIASSPCILERGDLPRKADKDPTWRAMAIYTREEVERLISDEGTLPDRRVLYGLKGLAAMRHSEAAALRWSQVDTATVPLGRISLSVTKTGVPRQVPIHPTLARLLAAWKLTGWRAVYGRQPTADDLVVPTRAMTERDATESQEQLKADLRRMGMRHRRGHDLRRTFVSLALADGARRDLLEVVTHGPRGDIISVYSTFPWASLCAEVAKLNIRSRGTEKVARLATGLATASASASKRWAAMASPTGFENVRGVARLHENAPAEREGRDVSRRDAPPDGAAVAKIATEVARAIRGGNLARARVLMAELSAGIAAMEEQDMGGGTDG